LAKKQNKTKTKEERKKERKKERLWMIFFWVQSSAGADHVLAGTAYQTSHRLTDEYRTSVDWHLAGANQITRPSITLSTTIPRSLSCDSVWASIVAVCPSEPWYDLTKIIFYHRENKWTLTRKKTERKKINAKK
jgi:hypothetical protein